MSGQKNTATRAANSRGGNDKARQARMSVPIIAQTPRKCNTQFANTTNELADLRRRYNGAVAAEHWQDAAALQRAYYDAERRRRQQLLAQAREVGRG